MESPSTDASMSTSNEEKYERSQTRSNDIDEQGVKDKSRDVYQRTAWNKLHVSIGYLVYKLNAVNIGTVKKELFKQNLIRAKHMFSHFIIQAQMSSTTQTHVYATLISVINVDFPEIGELVLKKCIMEFLSSYFHNEELDGRASVMFIGHLINQGVADETLAVELLEFFFGKHDSFTTKLAIVILEVCGEKITQINKDILNGVFNVVRNFSNNKELVKEDENDLKRILEFQENGFKFQQLDLVPEYQYQITHCLTLESDLDSTSNAMGYRYDPEFELNEKIYKNLVLESQGYDSEEESELESATDFNNHYDGKKKLIEVMKYINDIEKNKNILSLKKLCLKKVVSLIDLTTNYTELVVLVKKIATHGQVDMELCFLLLDKCCEHTTYEPKYGLITKLFCAVKNSFADMVQITFIYCYVTCDSFVSNRAEMIAKYFAHLANLGLIPHKLLAFLQGDSIYPDTNYADIFLQEFNNSLNDWNYFKLQPNTFLFSTTEVIDL